MAADRKYSEKAFAAAVNRYFSSITRERELTEQVPTGKYDEKGHPIFAERVVQNRLGKPVKVTEYLLPPNVGDLCEALKISRTTFDNYASIQGYRETVAAAREKMQTWNERELLTRGGKDIKGIVFNLENNYGYSERRDVSVGGVEDLLRTLGEGEKF